MNELFLSAAQVLTVWYVRKHASEHVPVAEGRRVCADRGWLAPASLGR
jgi:hypothetical protein